MDENYEKLIFQNVTKEENIIVTYYLETTDNRYNLKDLAWNLAVGQSIGNPNTRSKFD